MLVGELNVHKIPLQTILIIYTAATKESSNNHVMAIIISFISLLLSKQYFCAILIIKKNPRDIVVDFRLIELQLWKFIIKVPSCDESHQPPFSSLDIFSVEL